MGLKFNDVVRVVKPGFYHGLRGRVTKEWHGFRYEVDFDDVRGTSSDFDAVELEVENQLESIKTVIT